MGGGGGDTLTRAGAVARRVWTSSRLAARRTEAGIKAVDTVVDTGADTLGAMVGDMVGASAVHMVRGWVVTVPGWGRMAGGAFMVHRPTGVERSE